MKFLDWVGKPGPREARIYRALFVLCVVVSVVLSVVLGGPLALALLTKIEW